MASQSVSGNGSRLSLENCLTNIFALTDLAGIRWKRLRSQAGSNMDVLDDPVLSSYAKCLKADMLCSWARVPITDDSTPQPSNFMGYAKELWVFWYGDEPTSLQTYLASELQETEQGCLETTLLSYECRTFLFKALHNVIERCLLAKQFVRIGKWFVQPQGDGDSDIKCSPLSFSFQNFFLHGESTVCVSVDVEKRAQLYKLTSQQLRHAKDGHSSNLGSIPSHNLSSVILAPYGLSGVLTGRAVSPADQSLADWQQFYPLANSLQADGDLPAMVEVAVGGVRMKYPSAFVVTTVMPPAKENKQKSTWTDRCEKCTGSLVARTTIDKLQAGKREDDSSSWTFSDTAGRSNCNCVKSKASKQKQQKLGSPVSPKLDNKRLRTPFHRRSPPIEKLLPGSQSLKSNNSSSQPAAGTLPSHGSACRSNNSINHDHSIAASTPQLSLKDALSSPGSFPQPSPLRTPKTPGSNLASEKLSNSRPSSVRAVGSVEEPSRILPAPHQTPPFSVGSSRQPQTPVSVQPASHPMNSQLEEHAVTMTMAPTPYVSSQMESLHSSQHTSPVMDPTKRPCLPLGPAEDDELHTDSLYTFSTFQAWLDLPLKKRFKQEPVTDVKPQPYEVLSHPLSQLALKSEQPSVTATYFLGTNKSDPDSGPVLVVKPEITEPSEPAIPSLMTSDDLKPHLSDLDKMFDSEDEGPEDRPNATSSQQSANSNTMTSHSTAMAPSGGMSMASAHAVGPVSAADLFQIYPTPPSHDNHNTALSPVDHLHPGHQDNIDNADIPEPTAAIYRTSNIAKYLSVCEYQPLELPSVKEPMNVPTDCLYNPWASAKSTSVMPLNSVENLPSTLSNVQPSSVRSVASPGGAFYTPGRTPLGIGPLDILQSPGSVLSMPPKSVTGLSSVENPSTHGVASTFNAQSLPEAQALLVNMTLSDSMLNLYKDQNFESCNLCVCNMNILGNDLGLYLPREKFEAQYKCSCGFSAVSNRHYGFCSGLFYDDECDIMNHRDDRFDKVKLKPLAEKSAHEVNKVLLRALQEQFLTCSPSLLTRYITFSQNVISNSEKKLEFERQDVCAVIIAALNTGQYIEDAMSLTRHQSQSQCWSRWSQERATKEPLPSVDVIQLLRSLQPALQDAVQKKRTTSLWDPNAIKVTGPMTWHAFFKQAGRHTDELFAPQPVPLFLVGNEDDWLRESPFALQHWDKLLLRPFGGERNISYVVVAPDNDLIIKRCKRFFQELSQVYSQCQLGKHMPYQAQKDGILGVGKSQAATIGDKPTNEWFNKTDSLPFGQHMKLVAKACKYQLAPLLSNKVPDITSPAPPASHTGGHEFTKPSQPGSTTPTPNVFSSPTRDDTTTKDILTDPRYKDCRPKTRDNTYTSVVIYLINPFASGSAGCSSKEGGSAEAEEAASTLSLIMCYQELLDGLPENLRKQTYLEIIPLHSVLAANSISPDQQVLRSMAFSVYSKIAKKHKFHPLGQTMTGFGPVADATELTRTGSGTSHISTPPYILAPITDNNNSDGNSTEDRSRVLFCAYCVSEDQRWLIASIVRDNGELLDTTVINVHVPNRSRRKKVTVIKHGIQKLFKYLEVCMSKSLIKWRLVIGRFGRLGHGELKEWSKLLSKRSLLLLSKRLREGCTMCTSLPTEIQMGVLGACLISIEPHASFNILNSESSANKEDKKNTASPLSTPQDASVTHILVIPNSTTAGGNHSQTEAQIFTSDMQNDSEGLLPNFDLGDDIDLGDIFGMVSNFGSDQMGSPPHSPTNASSMFGQPGGIASSRRGTVTSMMDAPTEDQVNLLQQPLAMGYIVSTAPTGKLPSWFYSAAPQTEGLCPVVLKSALHFHAVCSQQNQDDYNQMTTSSSQKSNTHPLDSSMTCDVLRFVLDSYNRLSWLTVDPATNDRTSCLPVHIDALMKLYHAINTFL